MNLGNHCSSCKDIAIQSDLFLIAAQASKSFIFSPRSIWSTRTSLVHVYFAIFWFSSPLSDAQQSWRSDSTACFSPISLACSSDMYIKNLRNSFSPKLCIILTRELHSTLMNSNSRGIPLHPGYWRWRSVAQHCVGFCILLQSPRWAALVQVPKCFRTLLAPRSFRSTPVARVQTKFF